jgi:hypothetical protein
MLVANRASTEVIDVFIDLNKGTVYLSSELFPFFCMYIVLPFSPFLLYTPFFNFMMRIECASNMVNTYIRPSSILNSPRFHAYCYLLSCCLSRASPGLCSVGQANLDGPWPRQNDLLSCCLSRASPGLHFFSFIPLFWFLCAMCTTFSSIFNFPHTRSVDHHYSDSP